MPFKALKGLKPGIGHKLVVGKHSVQVYPVYAGAVPSTAAIRSALAQVRAYYARDVTLKGQTGARIFRRGYAPVEATPGSEISELIQRRNAI